MPLLMRMEICIHTLYAADAMSTVCLPHFAKHVYSINIYTSSKLKSLKIELCSINLKWIAWIIVLPNNMILLSKDLCALILIDFMYHRTN